MRAPSTRCQRTSVADSMLGFRTDGASKSRSDPSCLWHSDNRRSVNVVFTPNRDAVFNKSSADYVIGSFCYAYVTTAFIDVSTSASAVPAGASERRLVPARLRPVRSPRRWTIVGTTSNALCIPCSPTKPLPVRI